ncbi:FAD-binding oxidoreductase [Ideonella sp.]|uniref:FAD-binding oxidoreductase n=1 Tax=Ideonella sp. TaxID=1929293 RepID=UPI0037BFDE0D
MSRFHDLLAELRALVGASHVLTDQDLSAWEWDWRKRYRGRALAVVRPANTLEVAAVVKACGQHEVGLVPQGGNTGLVGGGVPDESGEQVVLSLSRMRQVRALDEANLTMTVDAGVILAQAQAAAVEAGLLFPLSLAAEGSCTIGGNLATNAGGTQVLRYGNARELCLGLEVVTAQGEVWDGLSGLRKDNTGYDLRDLFVGSEGTLGVITGATLKLFPAPAAKVTALAACQSIDQTVALLHRARQHLDAQLTGFEIMAEAALQLVAQHFPALPQPLPPTPWCVLLEASGPEAACRAAMEQVLEAALEAEEIHDAALADNLSQAKAMWHLRESIPLAQSQDGLNIKHDVSLLVSAIPAFVRGMGQRLSDALPGARLITFGHLGDGNLHYNVQAPLGQEPAAFLAQHEAQINAWVYDDIMQRGGSFSAEHGIGALKREDLVQRKPAVAVAMMRVIKQALDPRGTLNPGKML